VTVDIIDRLRAVSCDREAFTADHAKCQCRLANAAADEIEKLRGVICSALDCLHHDDFSGARKTLDGSRRKPRQ